MSKRTQKRGRPHVARDPSSYLARVWDSIQMLEDAGGAWDDDPRDYHLVAMLSALRLLLIDGGGLVSRVQSLKRMVFTSTAVLPPPDMRMYGGGLTVTGPPSANNPGAGSRQMPMCQIPGFDESPHSQVKFDRWWTEEEAVRHGDFGVTREFLVYEMANTDALHFDHALDADYVRLRRPIDYMSVVDANGVEAILDTVAQASLRQIVWETHRSLVSNLLPRFPRP